MKLLAGSSSFDDDNEVNVFFNMASISTFFSGQAIESSSSKSGQSRENEAVKNTNKQTNWFSIDENFGKGELLKERIKNLKD